MRDILDKFKESKSGTVDRYTLKEVDRVSFLSQLPELYRLSYISMCKLKTIMRKNGLSGKACLQQFVLPDPSLSSIISGDFGEMLSYLIVKEYQKSINIPVVGPRKWQWKGDKNKAAPYSDIVLFHTKSNKPAEDDTIISVEVKMKSVANRNNPLQESIDDAEKDRLSRLAKTLAWFDVKLALDGKPNLRRRLDRFRVPADYPTYKKQHKAIAIIDEALINDELEKKLTIANPELQVLAVSMEQLKSAYESTFLEISNITW